jgi:nucleoside phosphorylase
VIHAGIKIRELLDAAGAATAGVRRGLRGCGIWQSVPVVSNHTLNTLLLGELTARRLRSRMGIVYTTANRNWELHLALVEDRLRQSRALAVDMESATVALTSIPGRRCRACDRGAS